MSGRKPLFQKLDDDSRGAHQAEHDPAKAGTEEVKAGWLPWGIAFPAFRKLEKGMRGKEYPQPNSEEYDP